MRGYVEFCEDLEKTAPEEAFDDNGELKSEYAEEAWRDRYDLLEWRDQ